MTKKKKESEVIYRIELTEKQILMIYNALEEWFRLRMGQTFDFCSEMSTIQCDLSPDNPNHKWIFDMAMQRRDHLTEIMRCFFSVAFEPKRYLEQKTNEMLIAEDIWEAIRVARGICKYPIHVGGEPFPKIEKIEG